MSIESPPRAQHLHLSRDADGAASHRDAIAWLVVSVAGIAVGVIAGVQHRVTPSAIVSISIVIGVATAIVARLLPRAGDPV